MAYSASMGRDYSHQDLDTYADLWRDAKSAVAMHFAIATAHGQAVRAHKQQTNEAQDERARALIREYGSPN